METLVRQVTRRLHEEHVATLALCSRLEATLAAGRSDPVLMRAAAAALAGEIERHFAFEESELFPRLSAAGEGDMAELLQ
jgi:iron-sulfur cluster repair protein YtfE (RIC family)